MNGLRATSIAVADNRAARLVAHFGGNAVRVVGVAMQFLGDLRVDLDADGAIVADFDFLLGDYFRRVVQVLRHHHGDGRKQPAQRSKGYR